MPLKSPNGQLQVAVNHSQQHPMASETLAPIDCPLPHIYGQISTERHLHGAHAGPVRGTRTRDLRNARSPYAFAATKGILTSKYIKLEIYPYDTKAIGKSTVNSAVTEYSSGTLVLMFATCVVIKMMTLSACRSSTWIVFCG